jgi:hypothetical protein
VTVWTALNQSEPVRFGMKCCSVGAITVFAIPPARTAQD